MQLEMVHKYQAENKKCPRMHSTGRQQRPFVARRRSTSTRRRPTTTLSRTMELKKNQPEANWQYPRVHKYQADNNKCLNASPSERGKHSRGTTPSRTARHRSDPRRSMFAIRAATWLMQMKFWSCDASRGLGLPLIVMSVPTG